MPRIPDAVPRITDAVPSIPDAVPRIPQNDVSDGSVWVIEGPAGERTLWAKLFAEIAELM